jgi:hypothetical protein
MVDELIYKDRAGNALYGNKSRSVVYATNAKGVVLRKSDSDSMIIAAKRQGKLPGIALREFVSDYRKGSTLQNIGRRKK